MSIPINYWAVIVSSLLSIGLGFLWYGPLFGKRWMELSGMKVPDVKPPMSTMMKPIVISVICAFFMAYTLAHGLVFGNAYLHASGAVSGLQGAFWYWLGFVIPVNLSFVAWEGKSWTLWAIHSGYWLVLLGIMGVVLSVWA